MTLKSNKLIVWVDIGTHFAQEYRSIFSSGYFYLKIIQHFLNCVFLNTSFIGFRNLIFIITKHHQLKILRSSFFVLFVEGNYQIFKEKYYSHSDLSLNILLSDNSDENFSFGKLYIANSDNYSQGSSIYPHKSTVSENDFTIAAKVSSSCFAAALKKILDDLRCDYEIFLRINCEGVEDSIIYSFKAAFDDKFNFSLGSLKDVMDLKGAASFHKLEKFLRSNKIEVTSFSSSITTWPAAFSQIAELVSC
jgi:hypothetical protein